MVAWAVMMTTARRGHWASNGLEQVEARLPAEAEVDQGDVEGLPLDEAAGPAAAESASSTAWPDRLQGHAQGPPDVRLVVDDQGSAWPVRTPCRLLP